MRFLVCCGHSYAEEVEAEGQDEAFRLALTRKLPLAIGEVMGIRAANPKRKSGWGTEAYGWTRSILAEVGILHLYIPVKRRFRLNVDHPEIEAIEVANEGPAVTAP